MCFSHYSVHWGKSLGKSSIGFIANNASKILVNAKHSPSQSNNDKAADDEFPALRADIFVIFTIYSMAIIECLS